MCKHCNWHCKDTWWFKTDLFILPDNIQWLSYKTLKVHLQWMLLSVACRVQTCICSPSTSIDSSVASEACLRQVKTSLKSMGMYASMYPARLTTHPICASPPSILLLEPFPAVGKDSSSQEAPGKALSAPCFCSLPSTQGKISAVGKGSSSSR